MLTVRSLNSEITSFTSTSKGAQAVVETDKKKYRPVNSLTPVNYLQYEKQLVYVATQLVAGI